MKKNQIMNDFEKSYSTKKLEILTQKSYSGRLSLYQPQKLILKTENQMLIVLT